MSERRRTEERVRTDLRKLEAPDEHLAEERARQVVEAAFDEYAPIPARSPVPRRAGLVVLAAAAIGAVALTPAGADVREWIADAIKPGEENAEPRISSLPEPGSVLVEATSGAWIVREDGSRRRLGDYENATWSPRGRFVAVSAGRELSAVDPVGELRWSIIAPADVTAIDWSPDEGYRIAYLSGEQVRVVAGDGLDDAAVDGARPVAPVWRPEADGSAAVHELAYVDAESRIVLRDTDTGRIIWRTAPFIGVSELTWSANGESLLAEAGNYKTVYAASGEPLLKGALTKPVGVGPAAISPTGTEIVQVRKGQHGPELVEISIRSQRERVLYRTDVDARGEEFGEPVFSPDGDWILLPWRAADQWLFIRRNDRRVIAVADISRQFEPGGGRESFPRVAGWCC